jgi:hypothetical protein
MSFPRRRESNKNETCKTGQKIGFVPLRGGLINHLDSRLRGNDGSLNIVQLNLMANHVINCMARYRDLLDRTGGEGPLSG